MISKADKKRIKKIIGVRYVSNVKQRLREKELFNQHGKEHSASMITNVMNGKQHEVIEETIYEIVVEKKEKLNVKKIEREALLKK